MAMQLVDKPRLFPSRCLGCQHGTDDFGPYLDTAIHTGMEERVYFCASCVGRIVRTPGLDLVPLAKLTEALEQVKRLEGFEHQATEAIAVAVANADRVAALSAELEGTRSQIVSLQRTLDEKVAAPARERREALAAEVARSTKPKARGVKTP